MPLNHMELISKLQRMVGINKWLLNLDTNMIRVEYGRGFDVVKIQEINVADLRSMLEPHEMEQYIAHWKEAAQQGHAGPALLPFVKADGSKFVIESSCGTHYLNGQKLLVGVYKRIPPPQKQMHNARLLSGFLETFIENSPSSIVVTDGSGCIISLNREFLSFIGGRDRSNYLRKSLYDQLYAFDAGFGALVRKALRNAQPERGSYEIFQGGMRQTLYWRSFPLSMDQSIVPPKVFAFDVNQQGPRAAA